jgi:hypothetical protein
MSRVLPFIAGAVVGYVLGTRAGREQYERIKAQATSLLDQPEIKEATDAARAEATRLYDQGRQLVQDALGTNPSSAAGEIPETPATGATAP